MREIKFRGKIIDNSVWIHGICIKRNCDGIPKYYIYLTSYDEVEIIDYDEEGMNELKDLFIAVKPETIGQYTGLIDKNGKEIYEGDVVTDTASGLNYEVKFYNGYFGLDKNIILGKDIDGKSIIIIGNIFENPELIN